MPRTVHHRLPGDHQRRRRSTELADQLITVKQLADALDDIEACIDELIAKTEDSD